MAEHNYHPHHRSDIDGLRALAILPVVAFHAFPSWAPGGFVGVDIFFVISGYLISLIIFKSLKNDRFRFSEFYANRIRRIFPALITMLIACYALAWWALLPEEFKHLGKHVVASLVFAQNFVLWHESGYFDVVSDLKPLLHLWSLAVEEQFYLAYPFLIWLAWKSGRKPLSALAILGIISYWFSHQGVHEDAVKAFFAPHSRFWELIAGSLLAYAHAFSSGQSGWAHTVLAWTCAGRQSPDADPPGRSHHCGLIGDLLSVAGLALILHAVITLDRGTPFPGPHAIAPVLGATFLLLAGPAGWVNRHILARKPLAWIGLISYPLYLWHWPLLSLVRTTESGTASPELRLAVVAVSFALAGLTYWLIEKPIRHGGSERLKVTFLCVIATMIASLGYLAFSHDGYPRRFDDVLQRSAMFSPKNTPWLPENQDQRCMAKYSPPPGAWCKLAKDGPPTLQVIGDSHAIALFPGLQSVLSNSAENPVYLGFSACLPFSGITVLTKEQTTEQRAGCAATIEQSLRLAERSPSIHTVIMASRGPVYLSGKGYYYETGTGEENTDIVLKSPIRPALTDPERIWELAMRETLDRLRKTGKKIVFVLDNPELGFDPKSCQDLRPLRLNRHVRQPCAIPRADFEQRNHHYRQLVATVLKDYPSVNVFDAAAPLCDPQRCWAVRNGMMLYLDDDHLSLDGARLVATELVKLVGSH